MKIRIQSILILFLIVVSIFAGEITTPGISEKIDTLFTMWDSDSTPGAAVMLINEGKILHQKGYGLANLESKIKISPETKFRLASVSKQFTAMAIMMLVERGKLSYETKLKDLYPEFPEYADKITIRHLLNHMAAMKEYDELFVSTGLVEKEWPRSSKTKPSQFEPTGKDAIKLLANQKELKFIPGEKFEYSNSGYVVLGQIVEKVSGSSFREFLKVNIFDPLQMNSSDVFDESRPEIPNNTEGYAFEISEYKNINYTPLIMIFGDGNIFSNLNDLYKWDQALYTDKLVSTNTLQQAFSPGILNDSTKTDYGFGWRIIKKEGKKTLLHTGGWVGFRNIIVREIENKITVVILSNASDMRLHDLSNAILDIVHGRTFKPILPSFARIFGEEIWKNGVETAIKKFERIKNKSENVYDFNERELNQMGYLFLGKDKIEEAVAVFKMNVNLFPESFNVYDSLGEAYLKKGEKDLAIVNYKKSLELNPENKNAKKILNDLE